MDTNLYLIEHIGVIFTLLVGWGVDKWLGDPSFLPHPVVGFGKLISFGEHLLNKGKARLWKGAFLALLLIVAVYLLTDVLLLWASHESYLLYLILRIILIFYCLAGTTLIREVRKVFEAVDCSIEKGRMQVARIVGRDTSRLTAQEVRTAALETLSENLSDGVIAPLFWYAVLGIPGMIAYKMVNTLDSMIGYKNARYEYFGRFAARLDDVANFIPARLTALLMIGVTGRLKLWKFVRKYGHQHASPNSGYPESALAGILDCRFGGPHNYFGETVWKPFIGTNDRQLTTEDMKLSVRINSRAEAFMILLIPAVQLGRLFISLS